MVTKRKFKKSASPFRGGGLQSWETAHTVNIHCYSNVNQNNSKPWIRRGDLVQVVKQEMLNLSHVKELGQQQVCRQLRISEKKCK